MEKRSSARDLDPGIEKVDLNLDPVGSRSRIGSLVVWIILMLMAQF